MGKGTEIDSPAPVDPFAVAQADFLYNRFNQLTPNSSLNFFGPGQAVPGAPQTTANRNILTDQGQALLGNKGGTPGPGTFAPGSNTQNVPLQTPVAPSATLDGFNVNFGPTSQINPDVAGATAVQTLPPDLQALENARLGLTANTLGDAANRQGDIAGGGLPDLLSELNLTGLPESNPIQDPDAFNRRIERAIYLQGTQNLERDFNRQFDTVQQTLENRGLPLGSEAADRTINAFGEAQSDALTDLAFQSVIGGGAESSRAFADRLAAASGTEGQRAARIGEQLTGGSLAQGSRTQQLNELATLLGLPQINAPPIQSFLPTSGTGVVDAFGLNVAGQNARAASQTQLAGAQKGGLSDIIGSLGGVGVASILNRP